MRARRCCCYLRSVLTAISLPTRAANRRLTSHPPPAKKRKKMHLKSTACTAYNKACVLAGAEIRRGGWRERSEKKRLIWKDGRGKDRGGNRCVQMACSEPGGYHNSGINSCKRRSETDQTRSRFSLSRPSLSAAIIPVRKTRCAGIHLFAPFSPAPHSSVSAFPSCHDARHLKQTVEATLLVCSSMQMGLIC